jgi:hypothetical protein
MIMGKIVLDERGNISQASMDRDRWMDVWVGGWRNGWIDKIR